MQKMAILVGQLRVFQGVRTLPSRSHFHCMLLHDHGKQQPSDQSYSSTRHRTCLSPLFPQSEPSPGINREARQVIVKIAITSDYFSSDPVIPRGHIQERIRNTRIDKLFDIIVAVEGIQCNLVEALILSIYADTYLKVTFQTHYRDHEWIVRRCFACDLSRFRVVDPIGFTSPVDVTAHDR
jgi:hypothetical protein